VDVAVEWHRGHRCNNKQSGQLRSLAHMTVTRFMLRNLSCCTQRVIYFHWQLQSYRTSPEAVRGAFHLRCDATPWMRFFYVNRDRSPIDTDLHCAEINRVRWLRPCCLLTLLVSCSRLRVLDSASFVVSCLLASRVCCWQCSSSGARSAPGQPPKLATSARFKWFEFNFKRESNQRREHSN